MKSKQDLFKKSKVFLCTLRKTLNGSIAEYLIVALVFTIIAIVLTNFVAFHITTQLFAGSGDATAGFLWLNYADHSLSPFLSPSNYVNYPYGETLGAPTFITYTALWVPLRILSFFFGPVAGLNLMMFIGYLSAAMSAYWLLKRLTSSMAVALFAGFATAFVPYAMYNSSSHLAYIFSYVFVLILAGFIGLWMHPSKKRAALFAAAIALAFYTDGYYVLIASVMACGLVLGGMLYSILIRHTKKEVWLRVKNLIFSVVFLVIFLLPIGYVQISQGAQVKQTLASSRSDIASELREYRANVVDFLLPSQMNPLLINDPTFQAIHQYKNQRSNPGESTLYIGYVVLALSVLGLILAGMWFIRRKFSSLVVLESSSRKKFLLIACTTIILVPLFIAFMFSPEIHIHGVRIPLPGSLLIKYNISLWRVMARFFIPFHAVLVVFAAYTLWITMKTAKSKLFNHKTRVMPLVVGILAIVVAVEYSTMINRPSFDFTKLAPGYAWLKQQPDIKVIAELPVVDPLDAHTADYVTAQVFHGKKLVNFKEPSNMRLNDTLGMDTNSETIDWAYQRGAQAIITHGKECSDDKTWGRLVYKDGADIKNAMCIYRLDRPDTSDTAFIRFNDGFAFSPNQPDPSVIVLNSGRATMDITDSSFSKKDQATQVQLTGVITGSDKSKWTVKQNNQTVAMGQIEGKSSELDVSTDPNYSVEIDVTPFDNHVIKLGEYTLQHMKATNK